MGSQRNFSKNKLALLGKGIQHSKSHEVYEKIFGQKINYSLLDFDNPDEIPSLHEIFSRFDGLSITTPYKEHFLSEVTLSKKIPVLDAINCIKKEGDKYIATNTDYLAVKEMIKAMALQSSPIEFILLGNGPMARITSMILTGERLGFSHLKRETHGDLSSVNLNKLFSSNPSKKIVINACSRSFRFVGDIPADAIYWDYNYNLPESETLLSDKCSYQCGYPLLLLQGRKAVEFWSEYEF